MSYVGYIIIICFILLMFPVINDTVYYYYSYNKISTNLTDWKYVTGDLLLFSWLDDSIYNKKNGNLFNFSKFNTSYHWNIIPNVLYSKYTHIGIVIIFNGEPCVYELTGNDSYIYNKNYDNIIPKFCKFKKDYVNDYTPSLININYLEHYGGHIYKIPYIGAPIDNKLILNTLNKNKKINSVVEKTILNRCILNNKNYKPNVMSCSAFIVTVLNDLNIITKNINKDCYSPIDVETLCIKSGKYNCKNTVFTSNNYNFK